MPRTLWFIFIIIIYSDCNKYNTTKNINEIHIKIYFFNFNSNKLLIVMGISII